MQFVREFKDIGKNDAALAGGKGASLGEMTQAGIPVPPGFVLLAPTFQKFIEDTDINVEIDAVLNTVNVKAMHTVEHASEKIQKLILEEDIPAEMEAEIRASFAKLGAEFVAVRSSATAEDSASAAWAGQLDSYLNTTEATLLENVRRCWASLFTPRAIFYRFEKGLDQTHISVAVVVQKMVNSDAAGIAFSVHPVTEDRNQMIIEAGFGLGEAVVSGQVTPDSYVVTKVPREILDINISEQSRGLFRKAGGGNEWRDLPSGEYQVITREQILSLAETVVRIENHYNFPCDIEWAMEGSEFFIVQSRPITTLSEISNALDPLDPKQYAVIGLYKSLPFSCWFWSTWLDKNLAAAIALPVEFDGYLALRGGYGFFHNDPLTRIETWLKERIAANDLEVFKRLHTELDTTFADAEQLAKSAGQTAPTAEFLSSTVSHARRLQFYWCLGWQLSERMDTLLKEQAIAAGIPEEKMLEYMPAVETPLFRQQRDMRELKTLLEREELWEILKTDSPKVIASIESNEELKERFMAHIRTYAWIQTINWVGESLTVERLLEQMTYLHEDAHKGAEVPPTQELTRYVGFATEITYLRQAGAEYRSIVETHLRGILAALAKQIDVSYEEMLLLLPDELYEDGASAPNLKEKIQRRKEDNWCVYSDLDGTVKIIDDKVQVDALANLFLPTAQLDADGVIRGQIGNKGVARGPVRIILASEDFHKMREGDVLVAPMTTPDYVMLMQKSVGIVTDMGGLLCHAAIVSRELKKPCVISTTNATQLLKDGDLVEVDADNGVVRILESK